MNIVESSSSSLATPPHFLPPFFPNTHPGSSRLLSQAWLSPSPLKIPPDTHFLPFFDSSIIIMGKSQVESIFVSLSHFHEKCTREVVLDCRSTLSPLAPLWVIVNKPLYNLGRSWPGSEGTRRENVFYRLLPFSEKKTGSTEKWTNFKSFSHCTAGSSDFSGIFKIAYFLL